MENKMEVSEQTELLEDVFDIAQVLKVTADNEGYDLSSYQILDIAVKLQKNALYAKANVVTNDLTPSALEYISMQLKGMKAI